MVGAKVSKTYQNPWIPLQKNLDEFFQDNWHFICYKWEARPSREKWLNAILSNIAVSRTNKTPHGRDKSKASTKLCVSQVHKNADISWNFHSSVWPTNFKFFQHAPWALKKFPTKIPLICLNNPTIPTRPPLSYQKILTQNFRKIHEMFSESPWFLTQLQDPWGS